MPAYLSRGRRHRTDMWMVVPITLSCRPRVLPGYKVTWNTSTTDIGAGTDTDFIGACKTGLTVTWSPELGALSRTLCLYLNANNHVCTLLVTCTRFVSLSACLALQLRYSLGLLNNSFPFEAILDLSCPFYDFHLLQVLPDIVFPSAFGSSYWSSCEWFPFVYFLCNTSFSHSIYVSKPTQSLGFNIIYYK